MFLQHLWSADEAARLAARELGDVGVLLLRHDRRARETENSIERNESACRRFKRLYSPDLNVLKECTRHGVRALSKLAVVCGWKKPEVLPL